YLKLDQLDQLKGSGAFTVAQESTETTHAATAPWKKMGSEGKKAAVHEEMKRVNQLPANSNYATHRMRVLNKVLQLMSIQVSKLYDYYPDREFHSPEPFGVDDTILGMDHESQKRGQFHRMRSWNYFLLGFLCELLMQLARKIPYLNAVSKSTEKNHGDKTL
ncbi:hypothetical protein GIB67_031237, partial [Kingdonia uniflora]